jgi:hypothetical protein
VALHRATVAEAEAAESYEVTSSMRRRRHHNPQSKSAGAMPSMKAALFISTTSSTSRPTTLNTFANLLDGVDEVAAKTGILLRNNAVARLFFGKSFRRSCCNFLCRWSAFISVECFLFVLVYCVLFCVCDYLTY